MIYVIKSLHWVEWIWFHFHKWTFCKFSIDRHRQNKNYKFLEDAKLAVTEFVWFPLCQPLDSHKKSVVGFRFTAQSNELPAICFLFNHFFFEKKVHLYICCFCSWIVITCRLWYNWIIFFKIILNKTNIGW